MKRHRGIINNSAVQLILSILIAFFTVIVLLPNEIFAQNILQRHQSQLVAQDESSEPVSDRLPILTSG
jgi:hypothetical protein